MNCQTMLSNGTRFSHTIPGSIVRLRGRHRLSAVDSVSRKKMAMTRAMIRITHRTPRNAELKARAASLLFVNCAKGSIGRPHDRPEGELVKCYQAAVREARKEP